MALGYAVMRWFHGPSKGVMVATPTLRQDLEARGFDNVKTWSRGVDVEMFRPRNDHALDLPRPIFLYVGRVAVEKNLEDFLGAYKKASPDFQTEVGYPTSRPGDANLTMCTNFTAHRYDCLSMTLEMPFKDAKVNPEPGRGWSPARSKHLARHCLRSLYATLPLLKA